MKQGQETTRELKGITLYHQNFPRRFEPIHAHKEHQFFVPLDSAAEIMDRFGKRYEVKPGGVAFVWSGAEHSFRSDVAKAEQVLGLISTKVWDAALPNLLCQAGASGIELFRMSAFLKELLLYLLTNQHTHLLNPLVPCALQNLSDGLESGRVRERTALDFVGQAARDQVIKEALRFIDDRYFEDLDLAQISMTVGVHPRTLQRRFEKVLGLGPKRYLSFVRVEQAKKLLEDSKMSITQIAYEVGFGSFSRFVDAFRSLTGQLPSDYRQNGG